MAIRKYIIYIFSGVPIHRGCPEKDTLRLVVCLIALVVLAFVFIEFHFTHYKVNHAAAEVKNGP